MKLQKDTKWEGGKMNIKVKVIKASNIIKKIRTEILLLIRIEKEKNYQENIPFQVCQNVDFVVKYFQEELGTPVQFIKK